MPIIDCHVSLEGNIVPGINQNAAQLRELLAARGIDFAVTLSTRAAQVDPLSGNRILKTMIEQTPSLFACLTAHTNRVDASIQSIRELMSGRRFVAVMLTSGDMHAPLHPLIADEILNTCRRYQKPIYIPAYNSQSVEAGLHLAKSYTMHRFVLVGMGGAQWRTGITAAQQATNIYLEISGALDRAKLPAAIEAVGSHRILFGSGLPALDPAAILGLLDDAELGPNDTRRILYENADKLFSLSEA